MLSALLITFREGLEAALIIGIILAYLNNTGNRDRSKHVWIGTALAVFVSLVVGAVIYFSAGQLEGRSEEIFEGIATLTAAGVLTWMIFWMRKQAVNIKKHLHAQIQSALGKGSTFGLLGLAFVAVVREGIETVLFLFAAVRVSESALLSAVGGILGLAIAIGVGYGIYKGTSKLNLSTFFKVTGLLLILFAAGLLAYGVHELQEAGIIPVVIEHVWDINHVIPEASIIGRFLAAIFGYNANPSLLEVIAYCVFLGFTMVSYFYPSMHKQKDGEDY